MVWEKCGKIPVSNSFAAVAGESYGQSDQSRDLSPHKGGPCNARLDTSERYKWSQIQLEVAINGTVHDGDYYRIACCN
jgi:hypothetical protein